MTAVIPSPVFRALRIARIRLILNRLLQRLALAWCVVVGFGIVGFLAEPWIRASELTADRWWLLALVWIFASIAVILQTIRTAPSLSRSALELDARCGLQERITTLILLRPQDVATPAGQALLTDAEKRVAELNVASRFPLEPGWPAKLLPLLLITLGLIAGLYHPRGSSSASAETAENSGTEQSIATAKSTPSTPASPPRTRPEPASLKPAQSEQLKELEQEIAHLMAATVADRTPENPEAAREKLKKLTSLEDRVKQFEHQQFAKLAEMERQFRELDALRQKQAFSAGPAQPLAEALAQGDLQKARQTVEELKKKAQAGGLSEAEQRQLSEQLNQLQHELQRLAGSSSRERELQQLIDEAQRQGRDAEALEREREQLRQETEPARKAIKQLAEQLQRAQEAASRKSPAELANELEQFNQQLKQLQGELDDLDQAEQLLEQLKQQRQAACEVCEKNSEQGQQSGSANSARNPASPGNLASNASAAAEQNSAAQNSAAASQPGRGSGTSTSMSATNAANIGGIGAGQRPDNPNAQGQQVERRIRGLFDPRGKKVFSGSISGAAFSPRTTAEIGPAIQQAIQEAPQAAELQRLPRDAKELIRDYFQNLGQQTR